MTIFTCFFSDMLYSLSSARPVLLYRFFLKRWMRKNLGFVADGGLWEQTQVVWVWQIIKETGMAWILLPFPSFKEDIFSPKSEAQSRICFGPLEQVDELDVLQWANRNKYSECPPEELTCITDMNL